MKTTFRKFKSLYPYSDGWKKLIEYYTPESLDKEISIQEIIQSNGIKDAILALKCVEDRNPVMLFCADVAESVLHLFEKYSPGDSRVRECIEAVRRYANNEISDAELISHKEYADYAAHDTAYDAAASYAADSAARAADSATVTPSHFAAYAVCAFAATATAIDSVDVASDERNEWQEIESILMKYLK